MDSILARMASSTKEGVFLYGPEGRCLWNKGLLKMYGINPDHMPDIIDCSDLVGGLTKKAADELGLEAFPKALIVSDGKLKCGKIEQRLIKIEG